MATTGDLKDISLPSLVQMISMEGRSIALVLRHAREEGFIFFDGGSISHARCGSLSGEAAVYYLLKWTSGTFILKEELSIPTRTVHASTGHLLLEAMTQIDEANAARNAVLAPVRPPSAAELAHDHALENDLILLLSRLEQIQDQGSNPKRPAQTLQALAEMINLAVAHAEKYAQNRWKFSLQEAYETTAQRYPLIRILHFSDNRLPAVTLASLYNNWPSNAQTRQQTFSQVALGLCHLLQTCFLHLVETFYVNSTADQWKDTWNIFLVDLTQMLQKIRF